MSQYMNHELLLFWQSFRHGAFLLILYDILRIFRRVVRHGRIWTAVEDFSYWMFGALYLFVCFYRENSGMLRGYVFLGILLGMCVWNRTLSSCFVRYTAKVLIKIRKILGISARYGKKFIKRLKSFEFRGRISLYDQRKKDAG